MSVQFSHPVRPQASWNVQLPVAQPTGGSQPTAQSQPAADPWANWSPKGQVFDHAYDAYMFGKFPLNLGGAGFWTGGGLRRTIATAFSKIPEDRLVAYAVREQFMKVEGLKPDHARVLQRAFYNHLTHNPALAGTPPLNWLAQYGATGSLNDFLLRGPLIVELNLIAAQVAMEQGFAPEVPGNNALTNFGQQAARLLPPTTPARP